MGIMRFVCRPNSVSLAVLILWVLVARASDIQEPAPPPEPHSQPCVGFLMPASLDGYRPLPGDVFVSCDAGTLQITESGDILSWAVDPVQNRLAIVREKPEVKGAATMVVTSIATGKAELTRRVSQTTQVVYTCGTFVAIDAAASESNMRDAVSGRPFTPNEGSGEIRCDAAQKTKVIRRSTGTILGGPLLVENELLGGQVSEFDISPNGRFVAFNDGGKICVYDRNAKSKSCLTDFAAAGRMSVWDDGRLIAAEETSQACPLTSKLITAGHGHSWPCPVLFEWRGGTKRDWIQFLGTEPQILPRATGGLLQKTYGQGRGRSNDERTDGCRTA